MRRVGYDADTQTYTYQDENGTYWEGPEGARYGTLRRGTSTDLYLPDLHILSHADAGTEQSDPPAKTAPQRPSPPLPTSKL